MRIFKTYTFTCKWWQMSIFKLALLTFGVAIGAYWHDFFGANLTALIVIAIIAGAYSVYAFLRQEGIWD